MISTAQIALPPRPSAASLAVPGAASDALASDTVASGAFSEVLALLASDPAPVQPAASPGRLAPTRPAPDLTGQDDADPVQEPTPSAPQHKHSTRSKPAEQPTGQTLASARPVPLAETGLPTAPADPDAPEPARVKNKGDLIGLSGDLVPEPVALTDQVKPVAPSPSASSSSSESASPSASPTSKAASRGLPLSVMIVPHAADAQIVPVPAAQTPHSSTVIRKSGQNPVIATPATPLAAAGTNGPAEEAPQGPPIRTADPAVPAAVDKRPFARTQQKPVVHVAVPQKVARTVSDGAADHLRTAAGAAIPEIAVPERPASAHPAVSLAKGPDRREVATDSGAKSSVRTQSPAGAGSSVIVAGSSGLAASAWHQIGGEAGGSAGDQVALPPAIPQPSAFVQLAPLSAREAAESALPQTSAAPDVPPAAQHVRSLRPSPPPLSAEGLSQISGVQGPTGMSASAGKPANATLAPPLRTPAGNPDIAAPILAVTPLTMPDDTPPAGISPIQAQSANMWQSGPVIRVGASLAPPELAPQVRVLLPFPILTPAQAFSRFQTMLDHAAEGGRPLPGLTQSEPAPRRDSPAPAFPEGQTTVTTVAQTVIALSAVPERKGAPAPVIDRSEPAPTLIVQDEKSGQKGVGPVTIPRNPVDAVLPGSPRPRPEGINSAGLVSKNPEIAAAAKIPTPLPLFRSRGEEPAPLPRHVTDPVQELPRSGIPPVVKIATRVSMSASADTAVLLPLEANPTAAVPKVTLPRISLPNTAVPNIAVPKMSVPDVTGPKMTGPAMAFSAALQPVLTDAAATGPFVVMPEVATHRAAGFDATGRLGVPASKTGLVATAPVVIGPSAKPRVTGASVTTAPMLASSMATASEPAVPDSTTHAPLTAIPDKTAAVITAPESVGSRTIAPVTVIPVAAIPVAASPAAASPVTGVLNTAVPVTAALQFAGSRIIAPATTSSVTTSPMTAAPITSGGKMTATLAGGLASTADLPERFGWPRPASNISEKPGRRLTATPAQSQGTLHGPVVARDGLEPHALVPTAAQAKTSRHVPSAAAEKYALSGGPPAVSTNGPTAGPIAARVAQPAAPVSVPVSVPISAPVSEPASASRAGAVHLAEVAVSASHVAVPADHAHHAMPKGFSITLAHSVLDSGHSRAELILEPAELGRLRFDLVTHGDQVQVTLAAERPETLDLLRRNADELRQEFKASGLDIGSLSFGQWGNKRDERAVPDQQRMDAFEDPLAITPATLSAQRRPVSGSGLDLRL